MFCKTHTHTHINSNKTRNKRKQKSKEKSEGLVLPHQQALGRTGMTSGVSWHYRLENQYSGIKIQQMCV